MPFRIWKEYQMMDSCNILVEMAYDLFRERGAVQEKDQLIKFLQQLGKRKERLLDYVYFYYHIARPDIQEENAVREELKLIAVTSVIESMMNDVHGGYKAFPEWYKKVKSTTFVPDIDKAFDEYNDFHGAVRNFKRFFQEFLDTKQQAELCTLIQKVDSEGLEKMESIEKLAGLLYDMRSEFVHDAQMTSFCAPNVIFSGMAVKGKAYLSTLQINELLKFFEKGFVRYWERAAKIIV